MTGRIRDLVMSLAGVGFLIFTFITFGQLGEHPVKFQQAHAQPTGILGPNVFAYTAVTTAQVIVPANPQRRALQICNPGATNVLWIAPQNAAITGQTGAVTGVITPAANGAGTVGVPVTASGTVPCFAPPVNAPSIGAAWAGFSTTTPVTVFEWP